ncbi:hypothetical protein [Microcystis phage Mae-JY09]
MERPAIGWSEEWTATGRTARIARLIAEANLPLVEPGTVPCGYCWQQGRIHRLAGNGEGLVHDVCPRCDGVGRVREGQG